MSRQANFQREKKGGLLGAWVYSEIGMIAKAHKVSFQGGENVLELDNGDSCTTLWIY